MVAHNDPSLPLRSRRILYSIITEFIASGEPVGSRTLAKKYGLEISPATIRNVLSDLEEAGFLHQPHTSAGRIPTDKAFRFFVDTLMQTQPLSEQQVGDIERRLSELRSGVALLRESGRVLSEMTGAAAVVVSPGADTRVLRQLRFIPTRPGELLAVLIYRDGGVENRFIPFEGALPENELTRLHNLLSDVIEDRTLAEVRDLCARRLFSDRERLDDLRKNAFALGHLATKGAGQVEVLIEGHARLLEHPELSSAERLREVATALDDRERLVALLDRMAATKSASVLVGRELQGLANGALGMVTAPYTQQGKVAGAIGVLGLVRMDYGRVVPMVELTAQTVSEIFSRDEGERGE